MSRLSNIIPVSDLRQSAAKLLKQLKESNEPFIITQRGRATAVMIGVDAYEKSENEKELLRLLAKGEREIDALYNQVCRVGRRGSGTGWLRGGWRQHGRGAFGRRAGVPSENQY